MPKTCFVIGPIGDPGTQTRADADDFMEYIVSPCPALKEFDYEKPVRADHLNEPGRITSQIIKLLMEADLVIADLTGSNANVYYELSLRHALGKPVIHMAIEGTHLSFDVRDNRTIFYTMHSRVAEDARTALADQIRHVHQKGYKPTNPIIETAGIIRLEQSGDPQQEAIGQVMRMIEGLGEQIAAVQTQQRYPNLSLLRYAGLSTPNPPATGIFGLAGLGKKTLSNAVAEEAARQLTDAMKDIDRVRAEKKDKKDTP
jgi:hypothetical protein